MNNETYTHRLLGCSTIPLSNYLKAIGILRLVSEQADSKARGWWSGDVFHLETSLSEERLLNFFLDQYQPTPIVGPWGARSGFFKDASENSAREALFEIESTSSERLLNFRTSIIAVRKVLESLNSSEKADTSEAKRELMMQCRSLLPDEVIPWLDATYVLLQDDTKYPPLLGTGGNEGSGSYTSGFSQQVVSVIKKREWDHALRPAIFGSLNPNLASKQTPGHFFPDAAGGPNSGSGFTGASSLNPWDYLLLIEGTLMFAAASAKRLEHREGGTLSYPFCVRQVGVGYGSAASNDEESSRAEMWLPVWENPCSSSEIFNVFSEGRAQVNGRNAKNGLDFVRSIASLGIDRGIDEFVRYSFQQRNGLSYFAVPIGRFHVSPQPQVELLQDIDSWLDSFRRAAASENAPSSANRALRRLEAAIFELCKHQGALRLQAVLSALGQAEHVLAISSKWRKDSNVRPVPPLSAKWLDQSDDGSTEFRLAASLAAIYTPEIGNMRQHLVPVEQSGRWPSWVDTGPDVLNVVWTAGSIESNLVAVIQRRNILAQRLGNRSTSGTLVFPGNSRSYATLRDIQAFIQSKVRDERILSLVRGLVLIDWRNVPPNRDSNKDPESIDAYPDAIYSILKLCHSQHPIRGNDVSLEPGILRLAIANRLGDATELAARRLLGSNLPPSIRMATRQGENSKRIAAATLFPITWFDTQKLARQVLKPESTNV
jgi:CRISPR-associated protein Csx17